MEKLRKRVVTIVTGRALKGDDKISRGDVDLLEMQAEFSPGARGEIRIGAPGALITYDAAKNELSCLGERAPLTPINGRIRLHLFIDRTSIDIFANDGAVYMPMGVIPKPQEQALTISAPSSAARVESLHVWALKSTWEK